MSLKITFLTPIPLEYKTTKNHLQDLRHLQGYTYPTSKGTFKGQNHTYDVHVLQIGPKNVNSALATQYAIQQFSPDIIILCGIAGGVKDVDLGDLVIGTKLYSYESGKETEDGFKARPETFQSNRELLNLASIIIDQDEWKDRCSYPADKNKVEMGPICAGDKLVAEVNSATFERIKTHFNDTTALEMEAYGFAKAASFHPLIPILVIRGVSDLVQNKSETDKEGFQEIAVDHAAAFAFELLNQLNHHSSFKSIDMNTKEIANAIFDCILPQAQLEAGENVEVQINPYRTAILAKVLPLIEKNYATLVEDPLDTDMYGALKIKLRELLTDDNNLSKELGALLKQAKESKGSNQTTVTTISDSKNVVVGSTFSAGGNIQIGDKTTNIGQQIVNKGKIDKQVNVDKNIGDINL